MRTSESQRLPLVKSLVMQFKIETSPLLQMAVLNLRASLQILLYALLIAVATGAEYVALLIFRAGKQGGLAAARLKRALVSSQVQLVCNRMSASSRCRQRARLLQLERTRRGVLQLP